MGIIFFRRGYVQLDILCMGTTFWGNKMRNFFESLNLDGFLPIIATAMKQNKYFCMSGAVNRQDESALQRLKDKLVGEAKIVR